MQSESLSLSIRCNVANALLKTFKLSDEDLYILTNTKQDVSLEFFAALSSAREIKKSCKILLQMQHQTTGLNIVESLHLVIENVYERLFKWIQGRFRLLIQEAPEFDSLLHMAIKELSERPVLFRYAFDEYSGARRNATVKAFIDALTKGAFDVTHTNHSVSNFANVAPNVRPIEIQSHDPLRYVGDILAWIHQLIASENEFLAMLLRDTKCLDADQIAKESLNHITEAICRPFKLRVEQVLIVEHDAEILYKLNNMLHFYLNTLSVYLCAEAHLLKTLKEVQLLSWNRFFAGLQQNTNIILEQSELPGINLLPSDGVREILRMLVSVLTAQDISLLPPETKQMQFQEVIDTILKPLLRHIDDTAARLSQTNLSSSDAFLNNSIDDSSLGSVNGATKSAEAAAYTANCLYTVQASVAQLEFMGSHLSLLADQLDAALNTLVAEQIGRLLAVTRLHGLVAALRRGHSPGVHGALANRVDIPEAGISEPEVMNALVHLNAYLASPDRYELPEITRLAVPRLRQLVRSRAADRFLAHYEDIYRAIMDPENCYSFAIVSGTSATQTNVTIHTPHQVTQLLCNI